MKYSVESKINRKTKLSIETYEKALEYQRIGNRAAREAQAENHRFGLPNIFWRNGRIVYEMPNGEIIVKSNQDSIDNK